MNIQTIKRFLTKKRSAKPLINPTIYLYILSITFGGGLIVGLGWPFYALFVAPAVIYCVRSERKERRLYKTDYPAFLAMKRQQIEEARRSFALRDFTP